MAHGLYLQHFILFMTYKLAHKLGCKIALEWKSLPGTNTQAYLAFSCYKTFTNTVYAL
jgi:hypothetical protein